MRWSPGDRQILRASEGKIAPQLLPAFHWHDVGYGPTDALLECRRDLPVRHRIPKRHNISEIEPLPYVISHGKSRIAVRNLARLEDFSETHHHQRTIAERRQRGGHLPRVEGAERLRQTHCRMGGSIVVFQSKLPPLGLEGV